MLLLVQQLNGIFVPKCLFCWGNNPENYKGWEHYHKIINGNHTNMAHITKTPTNFNNNTPYLIPHSLQKQIKSMLLHSISTKQKLEQYISKVDRYINYIWKPIKNFRKPKLSTVPLRKKQ